MYSSWKFGYKSISRSNDIVFLTHTVNFLFLINWNQNLRIIFQLKKIHAGCWHKMSSKLHIFPASNKAIAPYSSIFNSQYCRLTIQIKNWINTPIWNLLSSKYFQDFKIKMILGGKLECWLNFSTYTYMHQWKSVTVE